VCGQAASALDHLSTFYVRNVKKDSPAANALRRHVSTQPTLFEELAKMLFSILVFGESANQWTLARPLLACVLAAELIRPEV
jgi:exportin-7